MRRIFQVGVLMAALILMSSTAWSNTYEDHVSVAPNGQGDVLIYPMYLGTEGGYETKLQVINTSTEMSAVAKVVLRSPQYSTEVRDFFVFLSPTDMWEGTVKWEDNQAVIYTEDDSFLISEDPVEFASAENSKTLDLVTPDCDINNWGYAEVFLSQVFPGLNSIPVDKEDIYDAYVGDGENLMNAAPTTGYSPSERDDTNILAGNLQVMNVASGFSSALRAVALKDYNNVKVLTPAEETIFGEDAMNNMMEVEAALNKENIALPYINTDAESSIFMFNFPTKLTRTDDDCNVDTVSGDYEGFQLDSKLESNVEFQVRRMDMMERVKEGAGGDIYSPVTEIPADVMAGELEAGVPQPEGFEAGWYRYRFIEGATVGANSSNDYLEYTGAPVIPFVLNFSPEMGFSLMYGSWQDGTVYGEDAAGDLKELPGFQFARSTPGT